MATQTKNGSAVEAAVNAATNPVVNTVIGPVPGTGVSPVVNSGATTVLTFSAKPPAGFEETLQQMLHGFQTTLPVGSTLPSASGGYSQATVVAELQQVLALYTASASAKAAATQAVATVHAAVPSARALVKSLKDALIGYFGRGNPALETFGLSTKARAKPSALGLAAAAAKARQTRQANGTMGKRQKAALALAKKVQAVAATLIPGSVAGSVAGSAAPASAPAKPTGS